MIIVPAYNEAENLDYVVQNIQNASRNNTDSDIVLDCILVNDGSKDHTAELCRQKGYQILDLPMNLGLTNAVRTGMQYAKRHHYDMAIQFDGDGQYLTFRHMGISLLLLLIFAASYLLLLWQPLLAAFVPGAANVLISKRIDPILDQHMPKKEG